MNNGLRRRLGLSAFTLYGLGNILGAGIYVLIGEVAGAAGLLAPLSFMIAGIVAAFAAACYAELATRFPVSAGEAIYVHEAFHCPALTITVGLLVASAGLLSCATLTVGFIGYLRVFVEISDALAIVVAVGVLGIVASWGIAESVAVAAVLTIAEVAGLLLVIYYAGLSLDTLPTRLASMLIANDIHTASGVAAGAFLAFFAFIGFEDMVNVAEEVKNPRYTVPRGMALALIISTAVYLLVVVASLNVLTPQQLASTDAPLAEVYRVATGRSATVIGFIGLFAVINGVLVQLIMATRVLYGMAANGWLPRSLAMVSQRTHTPVRATVLCSVLVIGLALGFPITYLASFTSLTVVVILIVCSLALIRIRAHAHEETGIWRAPRWVPWIGIVVATALVLGKVLQVSGE